MCSNVEKPDITIGLPVYNGEKFLQQKLESFNNQTLKNYQLIISDNASTDKTEEICKKFMQNDKRIIYFRQEKNIGAIQNFYFVLNKAKTKYFVWSAVDDFMYPNFLESNIGYLERTLEVACFKSSIFTSLSTSRAVITKYGTSFSVMETQNKSIKSNFKRK